MVKSHAGGLRAGSGGVAALTCCSLLPPAGDSELQARKASSILEGAGPHSGPRSGPGGAPSAVLTGSGASAPGVLGTHDRIPL